MLCRTLQRGFHLHHHLGAAAISSRAAAAAAAPPAAAASQQRSMATSSSAAAAPTHNTPGACSAGAAAAGLLVAEEDRYDGIIVDPQHLPSDPEAFRTALQLSLQVWLQQGKRGVWLKVPRDLSQLIPVAVTPGFTFHHAEKDYVMMTKWLPTDAADTLPPNASHQVGVGAIVVNEEQKVLVVQEANGPLKGQGVWKMPTGLVHAGEDLIEAVEREVLEETGVQVKFDAVIAVRQAHGFAFGKSDLFFCCGCRPVGSTLDVKKCEREIAAVSWITFEEYMAQPFFANLSLGYHTLIASSQAWAQGRYSGLQGRVFEGTATRPRRDLLLWSADASDFIDAAVVEERAAIAAAAAAAANGGS